MFYFLLVVVLLSYLLTYVIPMVACSSTHKHLLVHPTLQFLQLFTLTSTWKANTSWVLLSNPTSQNTQKKLPWKVRLTSRSSRSLLKQSCKVCSFVSWLKRQNVLLNYTNKSYFWSGEYLHETQTDCSSTISFTTQLNIQTNLSYIQYDS